MAKIIQLRPPRGAMSEQGWADVEGDFRLYLTVNCSKETVRSYMSGARLFHKWCVRRGVEMLVASPQDAASWFADSVSRQAKSTAINKMLGLRFFYRFAREHGLRSDDPTAAIPVSRPKRKVKTPYTGDELRQLLAAAKQGEYQRARPHRDVALLMVCIDTAARREEVARLHVRDIDWKRSELIIRGKGDKQRRVAMGRKARAALRKYVGDRAGPVWLNAAGLPLTGPRIYELLRLIADSTDISGANVHRFRTTAATRMLRAGMLLDELQRIMGHSDIETTAAYAAHNVDSRALEAQRRLSIADHIMSVAKLPTFLSAVPTERQKSALRRAEQQLREDLDARRRGRDKHSADAAGGAGREVVAQRGRPTG